MKLGEGLTDDERDTLELERARELYDRADYVIQQFHSEYPDAQWVALGFDSLEFHAFGMENTLPSPEEHAEWEAEKNEPVIILVPTTKVITEGLESFDGVGFDEND